ncbi:glycosyl hydrolase family 18 protein [Actinomadura parmotrematis]|uniref:chitinase n=1 Tax=Actinomadura parmotrematis TaxID=2864039 RepID=A0ABS7FQ54_9ACTN|nr:glycosyl hydrolase family 18 protein [Actinomadura parmotrematis]MBW8482496.1 cellulose binding domain-containing protein [Actinomadura parmotrematis]
MSRRIGALLGALAMAAAGGLLGAPPALSAGSVTATCAKTSDWGTGFDGRCTVTNGTGTALNGWKVELDLPSGTAIGSTYDAVKAVSGDHYTFTNASYNGTVAAGASVAFGFGGTGPGWVTGCKVDGGACDGSGGGTADTQAPTAPSGLKSTGSTSTSVALSWTASTDNVAVTGYDVYQGATKAASVTGTSATVTGLTAKTAYTFTVKARDAAGNTSAASSAVSVTTPDGGTTQPGGKKVVGYFVDWGVYQRNYHVKNIDTSGSAAKLTHINYAFGNVQNGQCTVGDSYADYDRAYSAAESVDGTADTWDAGALRGSFNQLRELKKKYPNLKVIWSFGGWTWSGGFTQAAANPAAFADSCYKLVEDPRWADVFDGIDIDWEYPNACGLSCDSSGAAAFKNLMSALRSRFGSSDLVTAAISADGSSGGKLDAADYAGAAQYVDWYNPMTYDYFGAWAAQGPTAPHSPLTSYSGIPTPGFYSDAAIQNLKGKGVPASKLLLGIGFYGRGWTGVTQAAPGGTATGAAPGTYEAGIEDYKVLKSKCPATGTVAGTAYAKCGSEWWSYDTPATIGGKMSYANAQGLGGAFFWELTGDTSNGELISAIKSGLG